MTTKQILRELKAITLLDFENSKGKDIEGLNREPWDGTLSFEGVKRLYFGLWNNGKNERGENMLNHMDKEAAKEYVNLSKMVRESIPEQPIIHFPSIFDL